jgi:hypothetical protein
VRAFERYGNPRDVAILVTLLQTGLRVGELVALELEDTDRSPRKGAEVFRQMKCDRHGVSQAQRGSPMGSEPGYGRGMRWLELWKLEHQSTSRPDWWANTSASGPEIMSPPSRTYVTVMATPLSTPALSHHFRTEYDPNLS